MKPIYLHILAVGAAALTLTACGNEDIEPDAVDVAPSFTATIEGGRSRVNGTLWESGDEIGISTSSANNVYNMCYVTQNGDGQFVEKSIEDKIYFKSATHAASVTFLAYYPYKNIDNPTVAANRKIDINTSNQTNKKSFDILFAKATATKDSPKVHFEFSHKMTQVTFIFKNGKNMDVSDLVSFKLGNLYMSGKFDTASTDPGFTSLSDISPVSMDLNDVKDGEPVTPLLLLPQTVAGGTSTTVPRPVTLEIKDCNNSTYKVDLTFPSNRLAAGNNYVFTITVNKTGLTVNNCTIENWNDMEDTTGWSNGTADSADDPDEQ